MLRACFRQPRSSLNAILRVARCQFEWRLRRQHVAVYQEVCECTMRVVTEKTEKREHAAKPTRPGKLCTRWLVVAASSGRRQDERHETTGDPCSSGEGHSVLVFQCMITIYFPCFYCSCNLISNVFSQLLIITYFSFLSSFNHSYNYNVCRS